MDIYFFCVRVILPPKTGSMETIKSGFQSWSSSSSDRNTVLFQQKIFCALMYVCTFVFNKINRTYQRHHQKCLLPCCTWVGCSRNDSHGKISCLSWGKEKIVRTATLNDLFFLCLPRPLFCSFLDIFENSFYFVWKGPRRNRSHQLQLVLGLVPKRGVFEQMIKWHS